MAIFQKAYQLELHIQFVCVAKRIFLFRPLAAADVKWLKENLTPRSAVWNYPLGFARRPQASAILTYHFEYEINTQRAILQAEKDSINKFQRRAASNKKSTHIPLQL